MVTKPFAKTGLALILTFTALTLGNCRPTTGEALPGAATVDDKMYCNLACDLLMHHHSKLPPYGTAYDCKKGCDQKLDDPTCLNTFRSAKECYRANCQGTFWAPAPMAACEQGCGPQLKTYYDCKPGPAPANGRAYVSGIAAKLLPEPDRDARDPNPAPGSPGAPAGAAR